MTRNRWIELDGVVNMRDLGGLPTRDGRTTQDRRLIRSDNLQDLTPGDVRRLVSELGVTDVVDLRSHRERALTGPGPLTETDLAHHHHSFFKDDVAEVTAEQALALPWIRTESVDRSHPDFWTQHYLGYLTDRPDSVAGALDVVSRSRGGAVVHCAAGKDRTGTVTAMALSVAGVPDEEIVADYVETASRIEKIIERLVTVEPYAQGLAGRTIDEQRPTAASMEAILRTLSEQHGGATEWLREHGWTDEDINRLRSRLVD